MQPIFINLSIAKIIFASDSGGYLLFNLCGSNGNAKTNAILVSVSLDTRVCQKISWTNGKINYCLYGTDGADRRYVYGSKKTAQCTSTAEYFRNNFRFFKGDFINETNHTDFYVPYNDIQL